MTTTQRNQVKRDELTKLLDEALDTDEPDGSLRSLITDTITQTLDAKMNELKTELKNEYKNDVANLNTEIDTLRSTVNTIKLQCWNNRNFLNDLGLKVVRIMPLLLASHVLWIYQEHNLVMLMIFCTKL